VIINIYKNETNQEAWEDMIRKLSFESIESTEHNMIVLDVKEAYLKIEKQEDENDGYYLVEPAD
tara:strand:- start:49 stop:240 length:192 start_codon:yes stop_codon:yes gene_type:complete